MSRNPVSLWSRTSQFYFRYSSSHGERKTRSHIWVRHRPKDKCSSPTPGYSNYSYRKVYFICRFSDVKQRAGEHSCRRLFFVSLSRTISWLFSLGLATLAHRFLAASAIFAYQLPRETRFLSPIGSRPVNSPTLSQQLRTPSIVLQFAQLFLELSLFSLIAPECSLSPLGQRNLYQSGHDAPDVPLHESKWVQLRTCR